MRSSPVLLKFLVPFFMVLSAHTAAVADGDPVHGATVFKKCASCHEAGRETNKMGPHLKSLIGRPAGSVSDFRYSAAMKDAGAAAMVWDEKTLAAFLSSPKAVVPGTSMRFFGLWRESEINDVIAYLKELQSEKTAD
jgi:cytochrome c